MAPSSSSFEHLEQNVAVVPQTHIRPLFTKCSNGQPLLSLPPKPTAETVEVGEPERCPNCGEEGAMEEVPDLQSGEDEQK